MHVLILGGTGPSGLLLIQEFLKTHGDSGSMVIYARTPSKIPQDISSRTNVTVIKGELDDKAALTSAFDGPKFDAVLSVLGPAQNHPPTRPIAAFYRVFIEIMAAHGCKRLIALSTPSAKDTRDTFSLATWLLVGFVKFFVNSAYRDIVEATEVIKEESTKHGIEWTIVRVPVLTMKTEQRPIAGYAGDGKVGIFLSRHALTEFYLNVLGSKEWIGKAPALSSA
ncbi:NAD(P)-binding protein [Cylindrobasidium torrendii FP15055 ss-10]|uniref:NAD(P)-binding protein n=1 Tax=Cylindrobasidium torrendii FP15055 ss-10 TaxID=1314674 RepID=A0A0D7B7R9_9AGAR|nr:NAD(P)-binding protein [Cylindrobasidium torrendii FP15055 ss-10]